MSIARRIRDNVARSRRTTSEILGAAAVLVEGHEQILQQLNAPVPELKQTPWTIASMRKEFGSFTSARQHFLKLYGVRSRGWDTLLDRVNTIESALVHLGYRQKTVQ
jgi:hypothetical protein